jgi:hypothetical protein
MGHFSDFFAASADELRADFPYRHSVDKEMRDIEAVNPFTGKSRKVRKWVPIKPVPDAPSGVSFPTQTELKAFRRLPHVDCKNLDHIMLSRLQEILGLRQYVDGMSELERLEFVTPGDGDMMFPLPSDFMAALAKAEDLASIAARWREIEEFPKRWSVNDTLELLEAVRELARNAIKTNRSVIFWIYG